MQELFKYFNYFHYFTQCLKYLRLLSHFAFNSTRTYCDWIWRWSKLLFCDNTCSYILYSVSC